MQISSGLCQYQFACHLLMTKTEHHLKQALGKSVTSLRIIALAHVNSWLGSGPDLGLGQARTCSGPPHFSSPYKLVGWTK